MGVEDDIVAIEQKPDRGNVRAAVLADPCELASSGSRKEKVGSFFSGHFTHVTSVLLGGEDLVFIEQVASAARNVGERVVRDRLTNLGSVRSFKVVLGVEPELGEPIG